MYEVISLGVLVGSALGLVLVMRQRSALVK